MWNGLLLASFIVLGSAAASYAAIAPLSSDAKRLLVFSPGLSPSDIVRRLAKTPHRLVSSGAAPNIVIVTTEEKSISTDIPGLWFSLSGRLINGCLGTAKEAYPFQMKTDKEMYTKRSPS